MDVIAVVIVHESNEVHRKAKHQDLDIDLLPVYNENFTII